MPRILAVGRKRDAIKEGGGGGREGKNGGRRRCGFEEVGGETFWRPSSATVNMKGEGWGSDVVPDESAEGGERGTGVLRGAVFLAA